MITKCKHSHVVPTTLARLKAQWQAEALEQCAKGVAACTPGATPRGVSIAIKMEAEELRRQAQTPAPERARHPYTPAPERARHPDTLETLPWAHEYHVAPEQNLHGMWAFHVYHVKAGRLTTRGYERASQAERVAEMRHKLQLDDPDSDTRRYLGKTVRDALQRLEGVA